MSGAGGNTVRVSGELALGSLDAALEGLRAALDEAGGGEVVIDLAGVQRVDTFGLAALSCALRGLRGQGRRARVVQIPPHTQRLAEFLHLETVLATDPQAAEREALGPPTPPLERVGERGLGLRDSLITLLAILGLGYRHSVSYALRGGAVAREQFFRHINEAGWGAVGIVTLMNFMIGTILAVQGAYALAPYGVVEFIPSFVAISMAREIGPLMTALLVAGRSGAGFAAELGTMSVTEELEALNMMGLPPRRYLLLPRFGALSIAVPALSLVGVAAGVLGGAAAGVVLYGLPVEQYFLDTGSSLETRDLLSGVVKSFFFGNLIAAVGCMHGLGLRGGTDEVGRASTRAVVVAIISVVVFDACFTALTKEVL